jgi:hypothetical protein
MAKLSGVDIHDFGTTFKAYRREVIHHISSTATQLNPKVPAVVHQK